MCLVHHLMLLLHIEKRILLHLLLLLLSIVKHELLMLRMGLIPILTSRGWHSILSHLVIAIRLLLLA